VNEASRTAWLAQAVEHTGARVEAFERGAGQADVAAEQYGDEFGRIKQAVTDAAAELGLEDASL
jgi:hypothetical protein